MQNTAKESHSQARILSQALPFMRRYAGQTIVVKYGGHAMGDNNLAQLFANDIVLLKQVGIHPIVVHGGGPQIGQTLERMKIKSSFIDGLRVTDAETVDVVEMVLAGAINKQVSAAINEAGGLAIGLSGKDGNLIRASKIQRTKRDPNSNIEKVLDLGFVGEPDQINVHVLEVFKKSDMIPVIAPIGLGPKGETFNINADTAAGAIAAAIGSKRLLLLTDVAGVLDADDTLIEKINSKETYKLIDDGVISGGMIPKATTCLQAVEKGVDAAVIIDGRVAHAILLELFTDHGVGTLISRG
ncbi:MAG TPA: acetylglutamate kinase [Rhodospirillales bacterium]|nr:acetylglutamate kinase [Rhodospirillales bacterium]